MADSLNPMYPPSKRARADMEGGGEGNVVQCKQLLRWIQAGGGSVGKVEIRSEPGLGRGIYATQDLRKGDILFEVPDNLILTARKALATGLGRQLASCCKIVKSCSADTLSVEAVADGGQNPTEPGGPNKEAGQHSDFGTEESSPELTERSVLYAVLLQARHCAPGTFSMEADEQDFGPYAHSLPDSFSTPFSWRDELSQLPAPLDDLDHDPIDLVSELGSLGQHLQEQFIIVRSALSKLATVNAGKNAALFSSGALSTRQWFWAHQAYSSRCFPNGCLATTEKDVQDGADEGVFIPLLDMFNSVEDPSIENWTSNVSWANSCAVLNCDVPLGAQIWSSYGPKGNRALLSCYGYCRWGNPCESVSLWVSALRLLSRDPEDADENMKTLEAFQSFAGGEVGGMRFELKLADPVPDHMLQAARICVAGIDLKVVEGSTPPADVEESALTYLRDLVVESTIQILNGDTVEQLEEAAKIWQSKTDGSTVSIEVDSEHGTGQVRRYACAPAAAALAFRHSQLSVLRAADAFLETRMKSLTSKLCRSMR